MSGYYARNPHDDAGTGFCREQAARRERAEEVAGDWFAYATRPQTAAFHQVMRDLRGLDAPRYDRERDAAKAAFERTTTEAAALCNETIKHYIAHGEVLESLADRWEELAAKTNAAARTADAMAGFDRVISDIKAAVAGRLADRELEPVRYLQRNRQRFRAAKPHHLR